MTPDQATALIPLAAELVGVGSTVQPSPRHRGTSRETLRIGRL